MTILLGIVRTLLVLAVIIGGLLIVLLTNLFPLRFRGCRLPIWVVVIMTRLFNRICNIHIYCRKPERLSQHSGLIFANHVSYLEPIILFSMTPVRFLAAIEVQTKPGVGALASSLDTVYVKREDRESRDKARTQIASALAQRPYPPLVLFPEGRLGPGDQLNPFRYGAFAIAVEKEIPFLPCAIRYSRPDLAVWYGGSGEMLVSAFWRLARFPGPFQVEVIPLETVQPTRNDIPDVLAPVMQKALSKALGFEKALNESTIHSSANGQVEESRIHSSVDRKITQASK
ncbi:1-acyl-sn-glycerol-3-phosphate acyltransferase [Chloroflexi bacterium TSY]|nr:1-acyl-sn-glycerol-3-phosphate acyltransferase [Chloroflexi bacterium TSY]